MLARSGSSGRRRAFPLALVIGAVIVLGLGAGEARPAHGDTVTLNMQALFSGQAGYQLLIPNFERVYPNITVNITYAGSNAQLYQLETTEFAAGNAPDLIVTFPGCGTPISICTLAKAGYLAPLVNESWVKRSLPLVTSASKYGQGLFGFELNVLPFAVFTNDDLFKQLGLRIPQTFSQLLDVCQKAKAAGTTAFLLGGATGGTQVSGLITALAVATLYGTDKEWATELRAGAVTFDGTPGWRAALQEFVDLNSAGCFQPGATGTSVTSAEGLFAQGQGLMLPYLTSAKGTIDAASPRFSYTTHPFPGGTGPNQTTSYLHPGLLVSINAHASAQNQAAAQTFIDFIARTKQNALYSQATGGLTQYEFLKGQFPSWMSSLATPFDQHRYVDDPTLGWWNANVLLALQQNAIGLITGQSTIDDVLNAMDTAWRQGPA